MSVTARKVSNKKSSDGTKSGRPGTVYDVNFSYKTKDGFASYGKRGFLTKTEAQEHEREMRTQLSKDQKYAASLSLASQTLGEYALMWYEDYKKNLRPSTQSAYLSNIQKHIIPEIGHIKLKDLDSRMIDDMLETLFEKGLSNSTVRYVKNNLNKMLDMAITYYRFINDNPVRNTITKIGKGNPTPPPYNINQMQFLLGNTLNTKWDIINILCGLYGLRRSEALGLQIKKVDIEKQIFAVNEQLPQMAKKVTRLDKLAPLKTEASVRILPITDITLPFFIKQIELCENQKKLATQSGFEYYDNDLLISYPDGSPYVPGKLSSDFGQLIRNTQLPHIRLHDLRHTAATIMYQLTKDLLTISRILGHTIKGASQEIGAAFSDSITAEVYIDITAEQMKETLEVYHNKIFDETMKSLRSA